jgi:hypothetical protein
MSCVARQTSSGPVVTSGVDERYGRQRRQARNPAASAAAADWYGRTLLGSGLALHSGRQ